MYGKHSARSPADVLEEQRIGPEDSCEQGEASHAESHGDPVSPGGCPGHPVPGGHLLHVHQQTPQGKVEVVDGVVTEATAWQESGWGSRSAGPGDGGAERLLDSVGHLLLRRERRSCVSIARRRKDKDKGDAHPWTTLAREGSLAVELIRNKKN